MSKSVLVINCGSSSIKFSLVDPLAGRHLLGGTAESLGSPQGHLRWSGAATGTRPLPDADHREAMHAIVQLLGETGLGFRAVGHRLVHGGEAFKSSQRVDDALLAHARSIQHLAPLHNPVNLLGIEAARAAFPDVPHAVVFDTAFHQTMPPQAYLYPVPYAWYQDHGIRRYGFHGTSHRYVTREAALLLQRPYESLAMVSAHLGNGCSAAAVVNGECRDTTMGMTPLEGLVMGTRCGDIDPSLPAHLCQTLDLSLPEVMNLLNKQSGLLGISGLSNDMRTLLEHADHGHARAQLAIEVFCYRLAKAIAALTVSIGRLDLLIFTGGIGEHAAAIRERVLNLLPFPGFAPDPEANAAHGRHTAGRITQHTAPLAMVVRTDEELLIARDTAELLDTP